MPKSGFTVKSYRRRRRSKKTRAKPYTAHLPIPAIPALPNTEWMDRIKPTAPDCDYKYGNIVTERLITHPWESWSQKHFDVHFNAAITRCWKQKGAETDADYLHKCGLSYYEAKTNEERYKSIEKLRKYTAITPYQQVTEDEDGITEDDSETEVEDDLWNENEGTSNNPIDLC